MITPAITKEIKSEFIIGEFKAILEGERLKDKMNSKRFWGYFLILVGFMFCVLVLFNLLFDSHTLHYFYLLYVAIGPVVSITVGVFYFTPGRIMFGLTGI